MAVPMEGFTYGCSKSWPYLHLEGWSYYYYAEKQGGKPTQLHNYVMWRITPIEALIILTGIGMIIMGALLSKGAGVLKNVSCWKHSDDLLIGLGLATFVAGGIKIYSPFIKNMIYGPK